MRRRLASAAAACAGLAAVAAGCGTEPVAYRAHLQPPVPIVVTAAIDDRRVRVTPARFGAGPVTIIVSNQSGAPQRVVFEADEPGGSRVAAGPIADQDNRALQADPRPGAYRLAVRHGKIRPAAITVGAKRPAGQDDLARP